MIEIVSGLIAKGQLEVIYTVDGKEYITPLELVKEIKDELLVHGGNLTVLLDLPCKFIYMFQLGISRHLLITLINAHFVFLRRNS